MNTAMILTIWKDRWLYNHVCAGIYPGRQENLRWINAGYLILDSVHALLASCRQAPSAMIQDGNSSRSPRDRRFHKNACLQEECQMSASQARSTMQTSILPSHRIFAAMDQEENLKIGQVLQSRRTGRQLTIIGLEEDRVYYTVEGFTTISPLFLSRERFLHLVGEDDPAGTSA